MKKLKLRKKPKPPAMPLCISCKHYLGLYEEKGPVCIAFPGGIPMDIFTNEFDHTEPYKKNETNLWDHDITFEEIRR